MTLEELRILYGYSVSRVARELKVTRMTIYLWESGKTMPNASHLRRLSKLYGISMDELLEVLEHTRQKEG